MKISLIVLLAVILLIQNTATIFAWYTLFSWLDIVMHILGGSWIALYAIYIAEERSSFDPKKNFWHTLVLILGCVGLVGVFWEFYEYFLDVAIFKEYPFGASAPNKYFDTLQDLFDDLLGGLATILLWHAVNKKSIQRQD